MRVRSKLRAGHTYHVRFNEDGRNPQIVKLYRETVLTLKAPLPDFRPTLSYPSKRGFLQRFDNDAGERSFSCC